MSSKVTTIRLCPETKKIAKDQIGNLSLFVRTALKEFAISKVPLNYHNAWRSSLEVCWPFKSEGFCSLCWPDGPPSRKEWDEWLDTMRGSGRRMSIADFRGSINENSRQFSDPDEIPQEESSKAISDNVGIIRRIWRFIF